LDIQKNYKKWHFYKKISKKIYIAVYGHIGLVNHNLLEKAQLKLTIYRKIKQ